MFKILLSRNSTDIDATENVWGWTALHYAVMNNRLDLTKLLVDKNCNMHIKSKSG